MPERSTSSSVTQLLFGPSPAFISPVLACSLMHMSFEYKNQSLFFCFVLFFLKRWLAVNLFKWWMLDAEMVPLFVNLVLEWVDPFKEWLFYLVWGETFVLFIGKYGINTQVSCISGFFFCVTVYRNASPGVEWCSPDGENLWRGTGARRTAL